MDTGKIVICPCGQWHVVPIMATEEHHTEFPCGLKWSAQPVTWEGSPGEGRPGGMATFRMKDGRDVQLTDVAAGRKLYMFLELV